MKEQSLLIHFNSLLYETISLKILNPASCSYYEFSIDARRKYVCYIDQHEIQASIKQIYIYFGKLMLCIFDRAAVGRIALMAFN